MSDQPGTWCGRVLLGLLGAGLFVGCQGRGSGVEEAQVRRYEQRMATSEPFHPVADLARMDAPAPVELIGRPTTTTKPALDSVLWLHLPDPEMAGAVFDKRLELTRFNEEQIRREYRDEIYGKARVFVTEIKRDRAIELTLADAIRRALANNYQIRIDNYGPAISAAQVVQAEALFDAAFFANINRNNTDRPAPNQLSATKTDTTVVSGGVRKLLATGAQVTMSQTMTRVDNPGFQFQTINPIWQQNFVAELRQPTLRGFGIDFNRAQINLRKTEKKINEEALRASVIATLNAVEQAYWDLVAARRDVVIIAELLAQAMLTLKQVQARADYDAYSVLLYRSEVSVEGRKFEFIDVKRRVRDAEDILLNLLNDPELPLSAGFEIIPVDQPTGTELVRDRFHEIETAIKRRPEVIQARHAVDLSTLQMGIAKNQALPQLDVIYRWTVSGLGGNADRAFDQETSGNFTDHFIGLEFIWNFGERAERAGIRIAALQQMQAALRYKKAIDDIITDCQVSLRSFQTAYEQLAPSSAAVVSANENLRSLHERQERKSPAELDQVFNSQSNLAQARRALLAALVAYNKGIVDVERAKGTLLEYDNVILTTTPE